MRKLASIQTVKHVRPIAGANNIEAVCVLGWECVAKKGEFREGDACVYFEIDSLLPDLPVFEFLKKGKEDLGRHRLRTIRFRGQISQGLALPLGLFEFAEIEIGSDMTEIIGVEKYEPPVPAQIQGDHRSFSWPISKTDEIRVQQDDEHGFISRLTGNPYYISLKIDGTSSSFMVDSDGEYHVCGRNYSYKRSDAHSFWTVSERYGIENKLRDYILRTGKRLAIQGEIAGPGIQKNPLGLSRADLFVFNVVDIDSGRLHFDESYKIAAEFALNFVPVIEKGEKFAYDSHQILEIARGKYIDHFPSANKKQDREGVVIRSLCGRVSFKAINNDFLLNE